MITLKESIEKARELLKNPPPSYSDPTPMILLHPKRYAEFKAELDRGKDFVDALAEALR